MERTTATANVARDEDGLEAASMPELAEQQMEELVLGSALDLDAETSDLLVPRVTSWMGRYILGDLSALRTSDAPLIASGAVALRGPMKKMVTSLDYRSIVTDFVEGASYNRIARKNETASGTIYTTLGNLARKIVEIHEGPVSLKTFMVVAEHAQEEFEANPEKFETSRRISPNKISTHDLDVTKERAKKTPRAKFIRKNLPLTSHHGMPSGMSKPGVFGSIASQMYPESAPVDQSKFFSLGIKVKSVEETRVSDDDDNPLAWQEDSLCAQTDPEAFFPEKGGSTRNAKKICAGCEVKAECLEYALGNDERFGIWGGLSERERRKLRKTA